MPLYEINGANKAVKYTQHEMARKCVQTYQSVIARRMSCWRAMMSGSTIKIVWLTQSSSARPINNRLARASALPNFTYIAKTTLLTYTACFLRAPAALRFIILTLISPFALCSIFLTAPSLHRQPTLALSSLYAHSAYY